MASSAGVIFEYDLRFIMVSDGDIDVSPGRSKGEHG